MIERHGRVDLISANQTVSGHYHLKIHERGSLDGKATATGTIRLFDNEYLVDRATAMTPVLACLDGQVEVMLELEAFTPGKTVLSFTCRDISAFLRV